jgi:sugar lactone lactonase YvrE
VLTAPRCSASLLLAVALVVAGCTADAGGGASSSAATTSAAPRSTAAEGYPVFAAEDVQEARLRLPGGPDWLAVAEDGVWVKRDDSTLDRLAPDTGRSALSVELGGGLCQGVGAGLGAVWACRDTDVVRVDPASGEVTAVFPLNKAASQGHLVTVAGRLWVLTGDGSTLLGVDPASGAVVCTIALGARGTDLGAGPAGLWVASQPDGQVLRVDPDAGTVAVRATGLDRPLAVAVTDQVWAGGSDTTVRLDPTTGAVQVTAAIGIGLDGGIAASAGAVFLRNGERFLVRLDASTGAPVSGVSADVGSAGDVVVAFGSVWTTASDDAALFRLPAG